MRRSRWSMPGWRPTERPPPDFPDVEGTAACEQGEGDSNDLSRAPASSGRVWPGEEGDDGAGVADFIPIIEMIGPRVIKVDRPLDESEA